MCLRIFLFSVSSGVREVLPVVLLHLVEELFAAEHVLESGLQVFPAVFRATVFTLPGLILND